MPKLKVKQLEWYMESMSHEDLLKEGYQEVKDFGLIGRNGYYSWWTDVWFEVDGRAYHAFPSLTRLKAREFFGWDLKVNDEKILPKREVDAMQEVLKTSRDRPVKKAIKERLYIHECALSLRNSGRNARKLANRFRKDFG